MADLTAIHVVPELLSVKDWQRFREIRIASLKTDPEAFGGNLEQSMQQTQSEWESQFGQITPVVATLRNKDVGLMTVENLAGDFGATCWIGGCWVKPEFRGHGIMRKMFDYVDLNAQSKSWQVQGLGVWTTNHSAIAAYQALGFVSVGKPVPSKSKPGMFYQRMIRKTS